MLSLSALPTVLPPVRELWSFNLSSIGRHSQPLKEESLLRATFYNTSYPIRPHWTGYLEAMIRGKTNWPSELLFLKTS